MKKQNKNNLEKEKTVNERQKEFYSNFKQNKATKAWYAVRNGILRKIRKNIGAESQIYELHKEWFGDLSNKKVLDLGCYAGNSLSYYLAENSKKYIAIDLSEKGISNLRKRLKHFDHAEAYSMDFLSEAFLEKDFDLIYAYGVLHHFRDTNSLIKRLKEKLSSGGTIISNDPLQTSFPIKLIRTLYRPFQSDKDWEWPFSKQTYFKYEKAFNIIERRGMLGKSKWFFLLNLLPYSSENKKGIAKKWHQEDWEKSKSSNLHMFRCMHLTMLMQKKE